MTIAIAPTLPCTPDPRGLGGLAALVNRVETPLPLKSVRVRATIAGNVCRTVIDQVFWNAIDQPAEAIYLFPLPEDGAVVGLELHAGEVVVKGEVRAREDAEAEFAAARSAGHRAALLSAERADVHTLRVTMLPPREEVRVRIEIVELLPMVDGTLRWRFPTTIAPRFAPGRPIGHTGPGALPDTDAAPDASRLQPPLRLAGGTPLDLEVRLEGRVRSVASSLHAVRLDLDDVVRVAPSGAPTLDRDFLLAFRLGDELGTRAWTDGTHTLVLVEPPAIPGDALPRDAVFVVDISGSMAGTKLSAAKKALTAALHGLVPGDRFQLIAFDDTVERFSEALVTYDERSLQKADAWVRRLAARGGTVMLPALQAAFAGETPPGRSRTVLFITDGQAHNDQELVACVQGRAGRTRLFTLGIDTAVNGALLSRLARIGGGTCELATPQDDIEALITRVEARFGAPLVDDLHVEGHPAASFQVESLFAGRPAALFVEGSPPTLEVRGSNNFHHNVRPSPTTAPIATLWARARIAALEDRTAVRPWEAEAARAEIRRLGLAHRLASTQTSWIAVERSRRVDGIPVQLVQPSELPEGWSESFRGAPQPLGAAPQPLAAAPQPVGGAPMTLEQLDIGALFDHKTARPMAAAPKPSVMPAPAGAPPARMRGIDKAKELLSNLFSPPEAEEAPRHLAAEPDQNAGSPPPMPPPRQKKVAEGLFGPGAPMLVRDQAPATPYQAEDPAGMLARLQGADGSFGGDVGRTAAALLTLVLLGHTRRSGLRTRTVQKAAAWLQRRRNEPLAELALTVLEAAEAGSEVAPSPSWEPLRTLKEAEGRALQQVLAARA